MSSRFFRSTAALVVAAAGLTPLVASAPGAFAAEDTAVVASGDGWNVERAAAGYQVTLDLTRPLPVVSDAPTLLVDGESVGLAVESADGKRLTAYTTDPAVADATEVTKGWASGSTAKAAESSSAPKTTTTPQQRSLQSQLRAQADDEQVATDQDPGAPGSFSVTEAEYDFGDQAVALEGIGGIRGEMTGKLYLSSATGERPTVVLMHGRHSSCSQGTPNPLRWPCGPGQVNVRSYLGYEGTARALATHGYNVVSIAVNAVNSNDNQLAADYGAYARGQMVLHTLEMLREANAGKTVTFHDARSDADVDLDEALVNATTRADQPAAASGITAAGLEGRFDLDHVGIMGHSRGGEGVMSAATLNQGLAKPFGIEAVLPLAPVDFGRMTLPDTPLLVVLPYCDGDVSNQQGQHMYDDSRNAFGDDVQRSALWVMGANHNFFNSVWTPGKYPYATGDDWNTRDTTSSCATVDPTRLTADQEYQVGVSYMTGYFRYVMGGEKQFAPLFDGSVKPATPSTDFADVRVMASQPHSRTTMITDFTKESSLVRTTGAAKAAVCVNATGITIPQSLPLCSTVRTSSGAYPHWAQMRFGGNVPAFPVTRVTWTSKDAALRITVPKAQHDVSRATQLTLKTMPDESVPTGTDFTLTVADGAGRTWSTKASAVNALAVNRLPGGSNTTLNKLVMQQLTVPTGAITGIDLKNVAEIRITPETGADGTEAGGVYLSDLAFDTPSLGTTVIGQHTTMNVASTAVDEGSAAGTVDIAVWLNRAARVPVTGYVSSVGSTTGRAGIGMEKVTFAPGETCRVVEMPLQGDREESATPTTAVVVAVTNTQDAVMGDHAFGWLTVREDDGVVNGVPAPEVGVQRDACAEGAAARTTGELSIDEKKALRGETVTVTGKGFRPGESVRITLGGVELDRVIASARGVATYVGEVPADTPLGDATFTAVGAGTGITATGDVQVVAARIKVRPARPSATYGTATTVTSTLEGATSGPVTFGYAGRRTTVEAADGVATLRLPATLAVGRHTVTASYAGEGPAVAASTTYTVTKKATRAALSVKRSVRAGTKVWVQVRVSGAVAGTYPTGKVAIKRGSTTLRTVTLTAARKGVVRTQVAIGRAGTAGLKAVYGGGSTFSTSTSPVVKVAVRR